MTNLIKSWNDRAIRIRSDRYVSLTDMAQASGKLLGDWTRLAKTKSYLKTLSGVMHFPITDLVQVIQGGNPQNQGTWGHPKVALRFAQWCSDEFAVQVDSWIDELLTTGKVELSTPEPKKAIAHYSDRVMKLETDLTSVPDDHWVVMQHCGHILLKVEQMGYPVGAFDLCDGSIGTHWANYRKSLGLNESVVKTAKYRGVKQARFPVSPKAYPFEELGIFAKWLRTIYIDRHLPEYLQGKYSNLAKKPS